MSKIASPVYTGNAAPGFAAIYLNDGNNDTFSENIIDLGTSGKIITYGESSWGPPSNQPMTNVKFENNTIISGFTVSQQTSWWGVTGGSYYYTRGNGTTVAVSMPQVSNNIYHNYAGGPEITTGNAFSDSNPIHQTPNFSGWTYKTGTWGPPGYTIPQTGTPPSSPH